MANKKPSVQIEYRNVSEMEKLHNNPRYIKEDDMQTLVESIKSIPMYFEAHPIVLSDRTGKNVIIDGNQRLEAAKILKYDEVPTVLLHNLTEDQEREIIIRANVTNGKWDWDILGNDWDVELLDDWGVDVSFLKEDEWNPLAPIETEQETPRSLTSKYITVVVPNEISDKIPDIKTLIEEVIKDFEGVTIS